MTKGEAEAYIGKTVYVLGVNWEPIAHCVAGVYKLSPDWRLKSSDGTRIPPKIYVSLTEALEDAMAMIESWCIVEARNASDAQARADDYQAILTKVTMRLNKEKAKGPAA